jgi:hypothetical protein
MKRRALVKRKDSVECDTKRTKAFIKELSELLMTTCEDFMENKANDPHVGDSLELVSALFTSIGIVAGFWSRTALEGCKGEGDSKNVEELLEPIYIGMGKKNFAKYVQQVIDENK